MGIRINTNVQSLAAQRALGEVKKGQDAALEKLASGSRINRASDDAAGLAISENLKADIRGSQQAKRNASDGISMIQVAEGGMSEITNILVRLRELSVQAASDTVGDKERKFTDLEFQQLTNEIERISLSTDFNGTKLLNGEGSLKEFQVGVGNDEFADRISFDPAQINVLGSELGVAGLAVSSKEAAQENLSAIDTALDKVSGNRAVLGALQNRLNSTVTNLEVKTENLSAANSRIRDTDVASVSADLAKSNIMSAAGTSVLAQSNNSNMSALKLIG